jgi:mannose-6-phosphate isomerase-like protein (cupin superfamily)
VHEGSLRFVFEDRADAPMHIAAGESMVIPPSTPHHVEPDDDVRFAIEFHRSPAAAS